MSKSAKTTRGPVQTCVDRVITDPYERMRLADLAADENPVNLPRGDMVTGGPLGGPMDRLSLALVTNSKWKAGRVLRIGWMGGTAKQRKRAREAAAVWEQFAYISFAEVSTVTEADIRISFQAGSGAWSYIGTDCLGIARNQATMNLGFDQPGTYEHEFGHALGCIHEHQHPEAGINWDKEAVYRYYAGAPNFWDKATVDNNIFAKYSKTQTQFSKYDPTSIMEYPIDPRLTTDNFAVGWNTALSLTDKEFIAKAYPRSDVPTPPTEGKKRLVIEFTGNYAVLASTAGVPE